MKLKQNEVVHAENGLTTKIVSDNFSEASFDLLDDTPMLDEGDSNSSKTQAESSIPVDGASSKKRKFNTDLATLEDLSIGVANVETGESGKSKPKVSDNSLVVKLKMPNKSVTPEVSAPKSSLHVLGHRKQKNPILGATTGVNAKRKPLLPLLKRKPTPPATTKNIGAVNKFNAIVNVEAEIAFKAASMGVFRIPEKLETIEPLPAIISDESVVRDMTITEFSEVGNFPASSSLIESKIPEVSLSEEIAIASKYHAVLEHTEPVVPVGREVPETDDELDLDDGYEISANRPESPEFGNITSKSWVDADTTFETAPSFSPHSEVKRELTPNTPLDGASSPKREQTPIFTVPELPKNWVKMGKDRRARFMKKARDEWNKKHGITKKRKRSEPTGGRIATPPVSNPHPQSQKTVPQPQAARKTIAGKKPQLSIGKKPGASYGKKPGSSVRKDRMKGYAYVPETVLEEGGREITEGTSADDASRPAKRACTVASRTTSMKSEATDTAEDEAPKAVKSAAHAQRSTAGKVPMGQLLAPEASSKLAKGLMGRVVALERENKELRERIEKLEEKVG